MIDVSIIIPVYNDPDRIKKALDQLVIQSYPSDSFEIIVADNGSTDNTVKVIQEFCENHPNKVRLIIENNTQSSYAARNKGLEIAKGKILAFTDSDCIPDINWLQEGVSALKAENVSCGGGKISFFFSSDSPNIFEHFDSGRKLNQESFIKKAGFSATANFFIFREKIDQYGLFRHDLISGGDYEYGRRLTSAGEKMIYIPNAIVKHPARSTYRAIIKKSKRIAEGEKQLQKLQLYEHRKVSWKQLLPVRSCVVAIGWENKISLINKIKIVILRNIVQWLNFFIRKF